MTPGLITEFSGSITEIRKTKDYDFIEINSHGFYSQLRLHSGQSQILEPGRIVRVTLSVEPESFDKPRPPNIEEFEFIDTEAK